MHSRACETLREVPAHLALKSGLQRAENAVAAPEHGAEAAGAGEKRELLLHSPCAAPGPLPGPLLVRAHCAAAGARCCCWRRGQAAVPINQSLWTAHPSYQHRRGCILLAWRSARISPGPEGEACGGARLRPSRIAQLGQALIFSQSQPRRGEDCWKHRVLTPNSHDWSAKGFTTRCSWLPRR